jgi:hypothetical protein
MTLPLRRLREFELTRPGPGQISLAVARHEATTWPSKQVSAYARHRARLLHELVDETGMPVVSWGETDGEVPREVVEVILEMVPLVSSIATLMAAWVSRPRKANREAPPERPDPPPDTQVLLPGIAARRHDGAELRITYRDGLSEKAIQAMVTEFLAGAVEKPPAGDY